MTQQQKKMKQYCNAIERRLNLPRDIKHRVMADFAGSIQERREAGQTDEEIYAEFGTPKQAAAELNEQMKEYAYRKSPWRWLFLGLACLSGTYLVLSKLLLTFGMILSSFRWRPGESASIGIIGGADGPTAVFVTSRPGFDWEVAIIWAVVVVCVLVFLRLRKCKQK